MGESIKVLICPLSGEEFDLMVSPDCRVESFKQKVADRLRTDTDNIRILVKNKELRFGSLKENGLVEGIKISVLPVMRAGLVGYVTTKSSVLLKSIPDEVLENAEIRAQIREGDQASITLHIEDMVIVFKLQLIASEPDTEGSSEVSDFNKKLVSYLRRGSSGGQSSSMMNKGKSDIPLSSELKRFLKDMVIRKLKSEMGMIKPEEQSQIPVYSKRRVSGIDYRSAAKRSKLMSQCRYDQEAGSSKSSGDCETENKVMKNKIAFLKAQMRQSRLQKKRRRQVLPCGWTNPSKLMTSEGTTCQTTCDSVQLAVHSVAGPSNASGYAGMKKGFLL